MKFIQLLVHAVTGFSLILFSYSLNALEVHKNPVLEKEQEEIKKEKKKNNDLNKMKRNRFKSDFKSIYKPSIKFLRPYFDEIFKGDICHGGNHLISVLTQHIKDLQQIHQRDTFGTREKKEIIKKWTKQVKSDYLSKKKKRYPLTRNLLN